MKKLLLIAICFVSIVSKAQISNKFKGNPKEFKELTNRTLVIQTFEENEKVVKKLSKPKDAVELAKYQKFVKDFNTNFKVYVQKYWKMNASIEVKNQAEMKALRKAKNKSYAVIEYTVLMDNGSFGLDSHSGIGAITYSNIEDDGAYAQIYLNDADENPNETLLEDDYRFALETLGNNVNWIISNNKVLNYDKYSDKIAKENCGRLKGKALLIGKDAMYKGQTIENAKVNYNGNLNFVSELELNEAFVNKTKNTAVLFSIPFGIVKQNFVVLQHSNFVYSKVIVDCETGEILWSSMPGIFSGGNFQKKLSEKEFKNMADCKIL